MLSASASSTARAGRTPSHEQHDEPPRPTREAPGQRRDPVRRAAAASAPVSDGASVSSRSSAAARAPCSPAPRRSRSRPSPAASGASATARRTAGAPPRTTRLTAAPSASAAASCAGGDARRRATAARAARTPSPSAPPSRCRTASASAAAASACAAATQASPSAARSHSRAAAPCPDAEMGSACAAPCTAASTVTSTRPTPERYPGARRVLSIPSSSAGEARVCWLAAASAFHLHNHPGSDPSRLERGARPSEVPPDVDGLRQRCRVLPGRDRLHARLAAVRQAARARTTCTPRSSRRYECGEAPVGPAWFNFNPRFYIIALVYIIFDVEIAFIYPVAAVFKRWVDQGSGLFALDRDRPLRRHPDARPRLRLEEGRPRVDPLHQGRSARRPQRDEPGPAAPLRSRASAPAGLPGRGAPRRGGAESMTIERSNLMAPPDGMGREIRGRRRQRHHDAASTQVINWLLNWGRVEQRLVHALRPGLLRHRAHADRRPARRSRSLRRRPAPEPALQRPLHHRRHADLQDGASG